MKINYEDWSTLDGILSKLGFGGYYDVVELLKMTINNINPVAGKLVEKEKDIYNLMHILFECSKKKEDIYGH